MDRPLKRKIAAIMAADVAEYTRIVAEGEEEALDRLASYRRVFDDFVARDGGRVFNTGGDSVMCEFPSAVEATRCAIDIQESLRTRNLAYPRERQMHFRIGIYIADVVERDGDLLGDGVNVAARLQTLAEPGSICVARNVQEAVSNKISLPFRDLGHREVKNLPYPVHAFQIEIGGSSSTFAPQPRQMPAGRQNLVAKPGVRDARTSPALWFAAALAIAGGGIGLYWMGQGAPPAEPYRAAIPAQALPDPPPSPPAPAGPAASVVLTENLSPAQAFERLARSGGIVRDASSAPELYHNARLFEARGESANARRDYLALAALGTNHLDPLLRLAAMIRAQDGRSGAREIFAGLAARSRAAALVHVLQFDGNERTSRLVAFAEGNPDFAPVHALLAAELGEDRQNTQTISERRREQVALGLFLVAEGEGRLVPYFLDQSVLDQWIDRAQKRSAALQAFFAEGRDRLSAQFMRTNQGWVSIVYLPEAATGLEYRLGTSGEFRATGFLQNLDERTGKPMPNPSFELPSDQGPTEVTLRYVDAKGVPTLATPIAFDPRTEIQRGMRESLERSWTSWLVFGTDQNRNALYFTHLVAHRCAIEKVEIGFNGDVPRQLIALPPCDVANPYRVAALSRTSVALGPSTENATVRLTYVGGIVSEVRTFPRPR
jgi:class 3 adenylate cyclase